MNKHEKKQLEDAFEALTNIFELYEQMEEYEENLDKLSLYDYCSKIAEYRAYIKEYLHIIEIELNDILGIFPKRLHNDFIESLYAKSIKS
jgi:hypothetical protein